MTFETVSGEEYEFDRWYPMIICASKHGAYSKLPDLKNAQLYWLMSVKTVMVRSPDFEI